MSFTVVIPAYNAESTIARVITELREKIGSDPEVIIVNDGSTDGTSDVLKEFESNGTQVLEHVQNRGYGAALKTGIRAAENEIVITFDSDGQHDPAFLDQILSEIPKNDMVAGARQALIHSQLWRMPGKWFIGWLANTLTGRKIPDLNCGFRALRKEIALKYLHLCPDGFSISTTMTLALLSRGYAVKFVPVEVRERQGDEKSKVSVITGLKTILLVLRLMTLFNPLRIFVPASALSILVGIIWAIPFLIGGFGLTTGSMLLILLGVLLFFFGLIADQISALRLERYE